MTNLPLVTTYFWRDVPNFGDRLAIPLLRRFAHREPRWAPIEAAETIVAGSIIEHLDSAYSGVIAGAGKLLDASQPDVSHATVLGVRGPLTAHHCGLRDVAIGDPGLLADELVAIPARNIDLGILPAWHDTRLAHDGRFFPKPPAKWTRLVISAWDDPLVVLAQIGRCKRIVTSSLHGIICADAFGLPRRFEPSYRMLTDPNEGGDFKYRDHAAAVGVPYREGEMQQPVRGVVEDRRNEIDDMLRAIPL